MGGRDHHKELRALIGRLGLTQKAAAALLSSLTGDNVPERTVRGWLAEAGADTKARCPGWPVFVLKTETSRRKK